MKFNMLKNFILQIKVCAIYEGQHVEELHFTKLFVWIVLHHKLKVHKKVQLTLDVTFHYEQDFSIKLKLLILFSMLEVVFDFNETPSQFSSRINCIDLDSKISSN